jgi:ABC-type lipoprotein export system ATPase subunit/ABC-type antimicrobial peptide transport system permease subunit
MELIRCENIHKTYHLGEIDVPVLNGVSFTIHRGEMIALMGASGSGKTTLMNILGCLDRPSSGKYWLDGEELSQLTPNERALVRTAKLGFVFQSFNLLPRTPAISNVLMPLDYSITRPTHGESRQRALELLGRVGLSERLDHEPSQMSGGQQQRVAIARALINKPALVLADEPTGNLDSHTSVEILQMFQQLNTAGITVVLVTHDPKVASFADRTIRIADGLIESDGPSQPTLAGPHAQFDASTNSNGNSSPPAVPSRETRRESAGEGNGHVHGNGSAGGNGNGEGGVPWRQPQLVGAAAAPIGQVSPKVAQAPMGVATGSSVQAAEASPELKTAHAAIATTAEPQPQQRAGDGPLWGLLPPTFRTAFGALRRNKMRSALTTLGIVIGISAVIAMTEIGQGVKSLNARIIASMGANNLLIQSGAAASGGVSFGLGTVMTLTPQDAEEVGRQCPAVEAVAPAVRANRAAVIYSGRNWTPNNIVGTTPDYLRVRDWTELEEGEMFSDRDVISANKVCVIGQTLVRELFQGRSPIGQSIRVQNVSLRVLGVLSRKGANMAGMDQDDVVIAPWTTIKYRISGNNMQAINPNAAAKGAANPSTQVNTLNNLYAGSATTLYPIPSATQQADTPQPVRFTNIDSIMAKAASTEDIPEAIDQITRLLRDRHHLRSDEMDDFNIRDMTEMTKSLTETSELISSLLLIVATISLIVGGVGIMNIMLVSVTERTKEIGLRMAVGARSHHILRQFLIEAIVLCLCGGAMGILLGRGATLLVRYVKHWPTQASVPALVAACVVSMMVGVVFGFYPAWKASRLDPIEALRYE